MKYLACCREYAYNNPHMKNGGEDKMEKDMTTGSISKAIFKFSIPIMLGNIFQQLYSMADTIIVGKYVGKNALAAVGAMGTIMFLIVISLIGMTTGFTVMTAQRFGAGDIKGMKKTVTSAVRLAVLGSVIITVFSMFFMKKLLVMMHTPKDIFADAYIYIMIICGGIVAQVFYNLFSNILRALGNSKVPLYFLIIAAVLNIVLDLFFIIKFHMGVAGAAYATVISQGVSGILCLIYINKKVPILKMEKEDWKFDRKTALFQLRIGIPMAFQFSITAIGTILVQSSLNRLGSTVVAGFTAGSKIESLISQAYLSLGTTMSTFCAQNMGAEKMERIRKGFRDAVWMSFAYSLMAGTLLFYFGKYMTGLFLSGDLTEIIGYVDLYVKCTSVFFMPLAIIFLFRNGLQGMGFGFLPMLAGVAELVGRAVMAWFGTARKSYFIICMASPMAWVFAAGALLIMYFYIMKIKYPREIR